MTRSSQAEGSAGGSGGARKWQRWLPFLAPAVLVVVALNQIVLTHRTDLSPWKGGGFGMFSAIRAHQTRAYLFTPNGERRMALRRPRRLLTALRHNPSRANLERVALVLERRARRNELATGLRVEVWNTLLAGSPPTLTLTLAHTLTYEFPDRDP
ncbi:MAG: hypothetical protein VYE73_03785 [Acidobacteriota bacterium]|nr:hypothetical protein [Acidobacteriota bacterium]